MSTLFSPGSVQFHQPNNNKSNSNISFKKSTRWLREASLQRMSMLVQNKTEELQLSRTYGGLVISSSSILSSFGSGSFGGAATVSSGLSELESEYLLQWVQGVNSGRSTLLAILDCRRTAAVLQSDVLPSVTLTEPVEVVRSMLALPAGFLCSNSNDASTKFGHVDSSTNMNSSSSNYLFDKIFSRSPMSIIREALLLVSEKVRSADASLSSQPTSDRESAASSSSSSLNMDQIHIAIKQLKLEFLAMGRPGLPSTLMDREDCPGDGEGDSEGEKNSKEREEGPAATVDREILNLQLQITIELIAIHLQQRSGRQCGKAQADEGTTSKASADLTLLQETLRLPLSAIQQVAVNSSSDDLEQFNIAMKPYLKQLSAMKSLLSGQLKEMQDSRAYFSLGLTKNASEEDIKRAYRAMAVRLHPDKPGGDTQRFQQLQDAYQQIKNKRSKQSQSQTPGGSKKSCSPSNKQSKRSRAEPGRGQQGNGQEGGHGNAQEEGEEYTTPDEEKLEMREMGESAGSASPQKKAAEDEEEVDISILDLEGEDGDKTQKMVIVGDDEHAAEGERDAKDGGVRDDVPTSTPSTGRRQPNPTPSPPPTLLVGKEQRAHLEGSMRASAVLAAMDELLPQVQHSACTCTALAQITIKWQRRIDKAAKNKLGIQHSAAEMVRNVELGQQCSLHQAIDPVENICDYAQQIAALAMELPGECGAEFSRAAAGNRGFLRAVESCMALSLGALKVVVALINAQEQLSSCIRQVEQSMHLAENKEIYDLLSEMLQAAAKSAVMTVSSAVDRVVESALAAAAVANEAKKLVRIAEEEMSARAQREIEQEERDEQEQQDYCQEDLEMLQKVRTERAQQTHESHQSEQQQQQQQQKSKVADEYEDSEEGTSKGLADLRDKIRNLQVQLKMQHAQALQTMNSELVNLQQEMLRELAQLPQPLLPPSSDGSNPDLSPSLLSLLAEFIDCSLMTIQNAIEESTESSGQVDRRSLRKAVYSSLSWMDIVLGDGSKDGMLSVLTFLFGDHGSDGSTISGSSKEGGGLVPLRIALLPDYRSKTLFLASLLDAAGVHAIIRVELRQRLSELLGPNLTSSSPASIIVPSLSASEESDKHKESASIYVQVSATSTPTAARAKEGDNAQKVSQRAFADIDENEENCPPNDAQNCCLT